MMQHICTRAQVQAKNSEEHALDSGKHVKHEVLSICIEVHAAFLSQLPMSTPWPIAAQKLLNAA